MQNNGSQGRGAQDHGQSGEKAAPLGQEPFSAYHAFIDEHQADDMEDDGKKDQWQAPSPIPVPDRRVIQGIFSPSRAIRRCAENCAPASPLLFIWPQGCLAQGSSLSPRLPERTAERRLAE